MILHAEIVLFILEAIEKDSLNYSPGGQAHTAESTKTINKKCTQSTQYRIDLPVGARSETAQIKSNLSLLRARAS